MRYLTIALTKGRLAKKTLEIFEKIGITCEEMKDPDSRKLIFTNEELKLKFFLAKGPDVPTYVEYGAADIGIVGKDTIIEEGRKVHEVLDLGFGKCKMCVCGFPEAKELLRRYGGVAAEALVESAMGHVRLLNECDFDDICLSVKCSNVPVNMQAYRMLHEQTDYPLHLGVTEAGTPTMGILKSAMGIGGLLCMGIGDTVRVSLTADPVEEVRAAKQILSAAGVRRFGPNLISCPTCGRTRYDMIPIAREVERRLEGCGKNITVAVMGCVVNGPGEAAAADVGIAGGKGEGLVFRRGEILYKVPEDKLVDALMEEIEKL